MVKGQEEGGSKPLTTHTFYSQFPPPSLMVPPPFCYFCAKYYHNTMLQKLFSVCPGSRCLGNPTSTLSSPASYTPATPIVFSQAPAPFPPPLSGRQGVIQVFFNPDYF